MPFMHWVEFPSWNTTPFRGMQETLWEAIIISFCYFLSDAISSRPIESQASLCTLEFQCRASQTLKLWIRFISDPLKLSPVQNHFRFMNEAEQNFIRIFKTFLEWCYAVILLIKNKSRGHLKKVDEQQLNWKRFEIYQTISCFGAFLQTLSFNDIANIASKSVKVKENIEITIESTLVKFLSRLQKKCIRTPRGPPWLTFKHSFFQRPITKITLIFWITLFSYITFLTKISDFMAFSRLTSTQFYKEQLLFQCHNRWLSKKYQKVVKNPSWMHYFSSFFKHTEV